MRQISKRKRQGRINLEFVDILAVLDEVGVHYSERGKNVSIGWVGVLCPMPGCGDRSTHMGICLKSPVIHCYHCGTTGNYLTYLAAYMHSWDDAIDMLKKHIPRELRAYHEEENTSNITHVDLPEEATKEALPQHIQYLENRGYDHKILETLYDFYYCGPVGDWANRILIPIYKNYKLITFTSIDVEEESGLRYKHLSKELSIIHCKDYLFGLEHATGRILCVVEGHFDKIKIGSNCVASLGTNVTSAQKKLMVGYDKVIIMFDGDEPGRKAGKKLAQDICAFTETELITLDEGMDPDKLPDKDIKEIQQLLRQRW